MEPCTARGAAGAALLVVLLLAHATGPAAALPSPNPGNDFKLKGVCKEVCGKMNGLDTFYDGECFCVLDHAPTPSEAPQVERAMQHGKEQGMNVVTSVVGYDKSPSREERCLIGLTSELRSRASKARQSALREPVVTVINEPAIPVLPLAVRQVAVPLEVPVDARAATAASSSSSSSSTGPPGTVPVNVLTLAGPLPGTLPVAGEEASSGRRSALGRRSRMRERAEAKAPTGPEAAGGLLGAASGSVPRYALSDMVVSPVQTGAAPFVDSSTALFSSMVGGLRRPIRGQQYSGQLGLYMPEGQQQYSEELGPYDPQPQFQQQTAQFSEFPSGVFSGVEYVRSAAQRAADSGAQAAHTAVRQATDFASSVTGAGLGAARGAVDTGRWAANTGLNMADGALRRADMLSSEALRTQMRAADQTVDFMTPPSLSGSAAAVNAQTQTVQAQAQPREAALRFPPAFSLSVMNPGAYYPDVRAAGASIQMSSSSPQISVLSQRSVDPGYPRMAAEPRGVLTDAATAAAGAVENAYHTVASGVQSGVHAVSGALHGVAHNVSSGVHTGVSTASNIAQDTYQGVVQGVQAGANTAAETAHGVAHGIASGVQSGVSTASNIAQDAYQGVASGVQSGVSTASGIAQDAYQGVATGVQTGASTISGLASGALDAAQGFASGAGHGLQHAAHQIGSLGHPAEEDEQVKQDKQDKLMAQARAALAFDPLQAAASRAVEAVQAAQDAAGSARDFVTSTANQGVNVAQNAQTAAVQQVYDVADKVQGSVQDVAGQVRGSVQDVAGQVRGTLQDVAGQGAQAVRGVTDAVKSTAINAAGEVRGQVQDLQQAVRGTVLDAQNAARDAILAAASQGTSKSQQMSQGALDAAQAAVTAAIDKVRQAMNLGATTSDVAARSAGGAAMQGIGMLRSAYQSFQPKEGGATSLSNLNVGLSPRFSMTPGSAVIGFGSNPSGRSALTWRWSRSPSDSVVVQGDEGLNISKHQPSADAMNTPVYLPKS